MKIQRPEPIPDLPITTVTKHASQFALLRRLPFAAKIQHGFFRRAPAVFAYGAKVKTQMARQFEEVVPAVIQSSRNCRLCGDLAMQSGFTEEAAALYITGARICQHAFDLFYQLEGRGSTVPQLKSEQLYAYGGLAQIRALPEDDIEYWQERLAEICAAILPNVAAFPHKGMDAVDAVMYLGYVAQVIKNLVPIKINTQLTPMPVAHFYLGGYARLYAALAHTELLGGYSESALKRIQALLTEEIKETEDLIYALIIGIAAARDSDNSEQYTRWFARLYHIVDASRSQYRSFEGRLFSLQIVFHQFRYSTETWTIDKLHDARDMFSISEMLKARLLLDELNGCYQQPTVPLTTETEADAVKPSSQESDQEKKEESVKLREAFESIAKGSMSPEMIKEVEKLSYWSLTGTSAFADPNPKLGIANMAFNMVSEDITGIEDKMRMAGGGYVGTALPVPINEIQAALADDELLIEFFIPRDPFRPNHHCWTFVLSKAGVANFSLYIDSAGRIQTVDVHRLLERGPLSDLAAEARTLILNKKDEQAREVLYTLFDYLIAPVIKAGYEPEKYRRWIIVPHGPLHLLPFQALVDEKKRFLIERVSVTTAPSASVWWHMNKAPIRGDVVNLLAIGNPKLTGKFHDLLDAEDEVNRIAEKLPWASSRVLVQLDADESQIKTYLPTAGIVHFATHGQLDMHNPRNGHRILLSATADEDGYLRASEVRTMHLDKLQLVVLNICDGAVCRYGSGDEPLGLLSAFIKAGAGNVLGGLWELPDAASKMFMLRFYNGLKHADPAAALQSAAKHAISKKRPLLYWAGFQLIGPAKPFFESNPKQATTIYRDESAQ